MFSQSHRTQKARPRADLEVPEFKPQNKHPVLLLRTSTQSENKNGTMMMYLLVTFGFTFIGFGIARFALAIGFAIFGFALNNPDDRFDSAAIWATFAWLITSSIFPVIDQFIVDVDPEWCLFVVTMNSAIASLVGYCNYKRR